MVARSLALLVCFMLFPLGFTEWASAAFGPEKSFPIATPATGPQIVWDLAVGPDHSVYVAYGAEIQRYSRDGRLLNRWGGYGAAPGEFGGPPREARIGVQSIAVDPIGAVYGYDFGNDRVQKFTASGQYIHSIARAGAPGTEPRPYFDDSGLATDRHGNLYVGDVRGLRKLSPDGAPLASDRLMGVPRISAGSPGLYFGGRAGLGLLDQFTLAFRKWITEVGPLEKCDSEPRGCFGTNDISAAPSGVWADSGDLVLFSPSGEVLQVCDRSAFEGGTPAADGTAVYSFVYVRGTRVQRYGPHAPARRSCDALAPALTKVRLTGRTLRYRLSEPGRITVRLQRRRRGRHRTVRRTSFRSRQGARRKQILSRRRAATLARGRYRLVVRAIDEAGNGSRTRRLTLRLR